MQEDFDVEWMEGLRDSSANEKLFNHVESMYFSYHRHLATPSVIAMSWIRGRVKVVQILSRNIKFVCGDNKIIPNLYK